MAEIVRYATPVFRLSFPALYKAESYDGGEPKFGCSAVWDPAKFTDKEKLLWKKIRGAMNDECKARFRKGIKDMPSNFKDGIRDGAEKADMEGYGKGTKFASLTTKMRPGLVDVAKRSIVTPDDVKMIEKFEEQDKPYVIDEGDIIYPGLYARATVVVYSYDNKSKGVSLGLMNLQKVKDGERLDSRSDAAEDFDDDYLEDDDDNLLDDDGLDDEDDL